MEWIYENAKWIIGVFITLVGGIIGLVNKIKGKDKHQNTNSQTQAQTVNIYTEPTASKRDNKIMNQVDLKHSIHN